MAGQTRALRLIRNYPQVRVLHTFTTVEPGAIVVVELPLEPVDREVDVVEAPDAEVDVLEPAVAAVDDPTDAGTGTDAPFRCVTSGALSAAGSVEPATRLTGSGAVEITLVEEPFAVVDDVAPLVDDFAVEPVARAVVEDPAVVAVVLVEASVMTVVAISVVVGFASVEARLLGFRKFHAITSTIATTANTSNRAASIVLSWELNRGFVVGSAVGSVAGSASGSAAGCTVGIVVVTAAGSIAISGSG